MSVQQMVIGNAGYSSDTISSEMFGINSLFTKDSVIEGGQYDTFVEQMGATSFRFPGGTVTEKLFDTNSEIYDQFWSLSDEINYDDDIVTAREFIEYADAKDATVDWVLPTEHFFKDAADNAGNRYVNYSAVNDLMDKVDALIHGEYGDIDLDTITIGNEYWYDHHDRSSAIEYGRMANVMSQKLENLFDNYRAELDDPDAWEAPKIAMQTVLAWDRDEISQILGQMNADARDAIDVVETHYYPDGYDDFEAHELSLDRLDEMAEQGGFENAEFYVSEWNVRQGAENDHGMEQASDMVGMMQNMVEHGVDQASVWGTTYRSLYSRLGRIYNDSDAPGGQASELTPAGEVMRMMSRSLPGTQAIEVDASFANDNELLVNAFGNDEKVVVFLSSRDADGIDLEINADQLVGDYDHLWVQQLSTIDNPYSDWLDEGDPLSYLARPYTETAMGSDVTDAQGDIHLSLDGYDIVKLEFSIGTGVDMWGNDALVDRDADYADNLEGTNYSDTIQGNLGDDSLFGLDGRDSIYGGEGNDFIDGGEGDDTLVTGEGNDTVVAGGGDDTIFAGEGENEVDIADSKAALFVDTSGDTVVTGFDVASGDTISFMGAYNSVEDLMDHATVQEGDIIFLHDDGGMTELSGAADQLDQISTAFVDFTDPEDVAETIDRVEHMDEDTTFADMLVDGSPEDLADYLGSLSQDQIEDLLQDYDLNEIVAMMPAENLPALLNVLGSDNLAMFFENVDQEVLLEQLDGAGEGADDMLNAFDADVFEAYSDAVTEDPSVVENYDFDAQVQDDVDDLIPALSVAGSNINPETGLPEFDAEEDASAAAASQDDQAEMAFDAGGSCFVATAAYEDKFHPDVAYLRQVRDHVLVHYALGRAFIWTYWRVGPWLARELKPYPRVRHAIRNVLAVLIGSLRNADVVKNHDHGFKSSVYLRG